MKAELFRCPDATPLPIDRAEMVLGRHPECDLSIKEKSISKKHCHFSLKGGALLVRDLDSTNGIYVNDRRVREWVLVPGDRLQVGRVVYVVWYETKGPADIARDEAIQTARQTPAPTRPVPDDERRKVKARSTSDDQAARQRKTPAKRKDFIPESVPADAEGRETSRAEEPPRKARKVSATAKPSIAKQRKASAKPHEPSAEAVDEPLVNLGLPVDDDGDQHRSQEKAAAPEGAFAFDDDADQDAPLFALLEERLKEVANPPTPGQTPVPRKTSQKPLVDDFEDIDDVDNDLNDRDRLNRALQEAEGDELEA